MDFPSYRRLAGSAPQRPQVRALQCLLSRRHLYRGRITGVYDRATQQAVQRFQAAVTPRGQRPDAAADLDGHALRGHEAPVLKIGSGGNPVRRTQRSLNAAVGAGLAVDGIFGPSTTAATRKYQAAVGLPRHRRGRTPDDLGSTSSAGPVHRAALHAPEPA